MMTVPMDSSPAPSSRELVQRLYKKNIQLENGLRRSAQSKVPTDANAWLQVRENYEAIILEDRDFSEKYEIELLLWQLHYRRIEEFRSRISAAVSRGSTASESGKGNAQPDRIKRIRSFFKSFLSEATGFYHDLILKIRAKYGLPLDYFLEGSETRILPVDEKKSADMKKGLVSCHRCLIYLGDLARYKGLYGEVDSVSRDYSPASSYYMQAASLCPSSGNPHNQLAILASYSGDDLVAIYRYSRSLAVETPFPTARDNLIIAFEKNRQSYAQLPSNTKVTPSRMLSTRSAGRGKGKGDTKLLAKDGRIEATAVKERECSTSEIFRAFCTRFVRFNGILFTRTSLETFEDIFSLVTSDLHELLSSGPEEELNFGTDVGENALVALRLIAILIFTVHNVKRESEGQSYAEILQRSVILKYAFTAAFEFVGYILRRCIQLHDAASSFFLPAVMVFIEWLACHPDVATGSDVEEKQAKARSFFWNQCVSFMNKLVLTGLASIDRDDDTCFSDMGMYEEGETGNRLALWEDYELRGFLPLTPAQLILDFSRKHRVGIDGSTKEKGARVQRILAAGRALMDLVQIDGQKIFFDPHIKKFIVGVHLLASAVSKPYGLTNISESNVIEGGSPSERGVELVTKIASPTNLGRIQSKAQVIVEGEEDEIIVFKPTVSEKLSGVTTSVINADGVSQALQMPTGSWTSFDAPLSVPLTNVQMSTVSNSGSPLYTTTTISQPPPHCSSPDTSKWLIEGESLFSDGLKNLNITENGLLNEQRLHMGLSGSLPQAFWPQISSAANLHTMNVLPSQIKAVDRPPTLNSVFQTLPKKNPISRPTRHIGPPPGFSNAPKKQEKPVSLSAMKDQNTQIGDSFWLDGYQPSSTKGMWTEESMDRIQSVYPNINSGSSVFNGNTSFPFPGKQVSSVQSDALNEKKWQDLLHFEQLKPHVEQQFQGIKPQHLLPEQQATRSPWSGHFFV